MKLVLNTLLVVLCLGIVSCRDSSEETGAKQIGKPVVFAVNYPLYYFAERIAGDLIDLKYPVPADVDPAFWEPKDTDIAAMQNADLILMNGATYSKWAEATSLPSNTQVDTSKEFSQTFITEKGKGTHSHGNGVVHSHDGIAFTTWLDMANARHQATEIRDALIRLRPDSGETFEKHATDLFSDLKTLDTALLQAGKKLEEVPLVASHPVYQYLARRYGLKIRTVLWEPEIVPDEKAMADLAEILKEHPAGVMLWEGAPAGESVEKLNALGVKSIVFQPCGNRPAAGDWRSVMKSNVSALESILK